MSFPGYESYFSPNFLKEPRSLQPKLTPGDWENRSSNINGMLEDKYTHVPEDAVPSSDLDPSSSMNSGQMYFPGAGSHVPGYNGSSAQQSHLDWHRQPAQYVDDGPCAIPLDLDIDVLSSTPHLDTSQVQYVGQSTSVYHTDWELQTHLSANSQRVLPLNHIDTETLNCNVSGVDVRQNLEEPGFLPTSGHESGQSSEPYSDFPQYTLIQGFRPVAYVSQSQATTTMTDIPSTPFFSYAPSSFQTSMLSNPIFPTDETSPITAIPSELSPSAYASVLYPYQHDPIPSHPVTTPIPEIQTIPMAAIPPKTSPDSVPTSASCSPITPLDGTPPAVALAPNPAPQLTRATMKKARSSPSSPRKKSTKGSKKPSSTPKAKTNQKRIRKNESPNRRARIRCRDWIDRFFPNKGPCLMCVEDDQQYPVPDHRKAKEFKRNDRRLEHLVSTHVVQVVKDMSELDDDISTSVVSLVRTEAQFAYARRGVDEIKCSFCPTDTSLVFRERDIKNHLKRIHAKLPETVHEEELNRLLSLMPEKTNQRSEWYSYHDRFLNSFPGGCPE